MDHLILPENPLPTTLDKVPLLVVESYDGGPFLTYPLRKQKPWMLPNVNDPHHVPYALFEKLHPTPKEEQESFMQTWLFFGLLNEVLGELYHEEDFLAEDSTETNHFILCTKKLRPLLKAACRLGFEKASRATRRRFDHLRECLNLVIRVSLAFHSAFDWGLMCSLAAVHEAIVHALNRVARKLGSDNIPNLLWPKKFFTKSICSRMLGAGWCPSDIERAKAHFTSTQTLYFLSRMSKNEIQRSHVTCTSRLCSSFQIELSTYQTKHRQSCTGCPDAVPNLDHIVMLLKDGKLPLLQITQSSEDLESLSIDVVALTPETPYVSISHVWADGLGNPRENSVPACQLSYIFERVNALRSSTSFFADPSTRARDAEGRPLLIWLDTLCCPVSPIEARSLALAQMRRTYCDARHVLVLDSGLQNYASNEITIFEALSRIFLSGWMNRLWTLQEARLARTIWIQFKDRAIELDMLMAYLSQLGIADLAFLPFALVMHLQYVTLRPSFPFGLGVEAPPKPAATILRELDVGLQHRSTTVAADEPLCIGNLLDLPAEEILNVPATAAARMGKVWELIAAKHGGIPQQIIGFEQPRLTEKGKRWAPRSLLVMKEGELDSSGTRYQRWTDPVLGIPSADGLLVKFPGIRLRPRQPEDDMIRNPWKCIPQIPEYRLLFTNSADGKRYEISSIAKLDANADDEFKADRGLVRQPFLHNLVNSGSCALMLLSKPTPEANWTGLLVQITKTATKTGILHVRHQSHIILSALSPSQKLLYDTAERLARSLRREPVTAHVAHHLSKKSSNTEISVNEVSNSNNNNNNDESSNNDEYISAVESLKSRIQTVAASELQNNPDLVQAFKTTFGVADDDGLAPDPKDSFWRRGAECFYHDFLGDPVAEGEGEGGEQVWCVD